MRDESSHQRLIENYLSKMYRHSKDVPDYQMLQEGISGASIYRLLFPDGEAILKITLATSGSVPLRRAQRELAFYRDLAGNIPLRVPGVLAMHTDADGVALLMPIYHSSPPAALWSVADYLEVARQLGEFHAAFWSKTEQLSHLSWLAWHQEEEIATAIQQAHTYWQTLCAQPRFTDVLSEQNYKWLQRLTARMPVVQDIIQSFPLTVCHGDCITTNILCDADGHFVWSDWQEVRFASGPEDLSFFLHRASVAGATVPDNEMLAAYHTSLEEHTGQTLQLTNIQRGVDAAELWVRVLEWPAYLLQASESLLADMIDRIHTLAVRLEVEG